MSVERLVFADGSEAIEVGGEIGVADIRESLLIEPDFIEVAESVDSAGSLIELDL